MSNYLKENHIVLASGSPRRIQMLKDDNVDFEIIKPSCEENINLSLTPRQTVMALALRKALDIGEQDSLIISCDTVVVFDDEVIGKPKDENDAFTILSKLRGKTHEVISGVCLLDRAKGIFKLFTDTTNVFFKDYTDAEIWDYIHTGEPMDKAGAYAIQGGFAKYIDHIEGDYDNIVGFPYQLIKTEL